MCDKRMVSLQRNFLWGGGLEVKKMCWVSWDRICQPKEKGGLGIKNMELFNSSLLCKWKWRCLEDRANPWNELLRFRYGSPVANFLHNEGKERLKHASIWWRDVWNLGCELEGGWFGDNIRSKLGDGNDIVFWKDKWIGSVTLRDLFPSLFNKATHPDSMVTTMGFWYHDSWTWNFEWVAELSDTETEFVQELLLLLVAVQPRRDEVDRRKWVALEAGFFTVKSAYVSLLNRLQLDEFDNTKVTALKLLWINNVPSKVSIFGDCSLEKLPTRETLYNKGILLQTYMRGVVCFAFGRMKI
jgi:hypothetical protein